MRLTVSLAALALATGCAAAPPPVKQAVEEGVVQPPASAIEALSAYYATIPASDLPRAPAGASMPADDQVLTRILVGSCNDEELESPALASAAAQEADLFLMVGDNVYGDKDGRAYKNNDADLGELRESFAELAERAEFVALREAMPMMVAWDDHDYGANDAGAEFVFKELAERVHERFWHLDDQDVGKWPGTYYARSFGPDGQRTQIIMLDTRYFRSPLTPTDAWGEPGKERYLPSPAGSMQDMLGAEQWTWLENQLQQPADLRLIVSSIQVLTTDGHGFEHWTNKPDERQRLFDLVEETGARGVVFVSGDRHSAFLYRSADALPYPVHELTASSLNVSYRDETTERDSAQLGAGYAKENFGAIEIDWENETVSLQILGMNGQTVRETRFAIPR